MIVDSLHDGRLPASVLPRRYDLTLSVDPERGEFSGTVAIDVEVREPVGSVYLHAVELEVQRGTVTADGMEQTAVMTLDPASETVALRVNRPLPPGPAVLVLAFSGRLNQQMKGLYEARAGAERYAFTQFEATDARRAFPCFDEPGLKASFRITAIIPEPFMALSNMEVETESVDRARRWKRVTFAETPRMSTYLVALAVAKLAVEEVLIEGTRVRVYARPEQLGLTEFAKEVMEACLPRLNAYFGLPYPLAKLDLVAVPDFAMGAMENWGAMFFRENRLLVETAQASASTLRAVANVITHEVVHQWFGNLVTMWWWDDLWLNEAFATWLACKIVDDWRPEWQSWVEFATEKQAPLGVDALQSTRPVSSRVRTAAEAEEMFDALTYEKGAAVLWMLEQFLDPALFRQGIRDYIAAHQYGNAAAADLWEALAKVSGQPVAAIAQAWFTKPGVPMVTFLPEESPGKDRDFRTLRVEQARFVADPEWTPPPASPWAIPLSVAYEDDAGVQRHRRLLTEPSVIMTLPATGRIRWIYGNAGEQGYYRVHHDGPLQEAVAAFIARLAAEERAGLLDHTWAVMKKDLLPIETFLELLLRCRGDVTRVVVEGITGYLDALHDRLVTDVERPRFAAFTTDLLDPLPELLGWEPSPGEGDDPKLVRAAVLWTLGQAARPPSLLRQASAWLERYWQDPAFLDPTLAGTVIRLAARLGNAERWAQYLEKYRAAATPEERDRYLIALGDFAQPALTPRILAMTLTEAIRGQDLWKPLRALLANPVTQADAWVFIKANWAALRRKGGTVGAQRIISGTKTLWSEAWRQDVERFFTDPANHVAAAERTLAQTLEFIRLGLIFRRRQQERLFQWLHRRYR